MKNVVALAIFNTI